MNKQLVYANGDSFIFGMEILGDDSRDPANKDLSFVKKIADNMGADYINNAYNSATNEFIFRKTFSVFPLISTVIFLARAYLLMFCSPSCKIRYILILIAFPILSQLIDVSI